jgi:hypothetical protein
MTIHGQKKRDYIMNSTIHAAYNEKYILSIAYKDTKETKLFLVKNFTNHCLAHL